MSNKEESIKPLVVVGIISGLFCPHGSMSKFRKYCFDTKYIYKEASKDKFCTCWSVPQQPSESEDILKI